MPLSAFQRVLIEIDASAELNHILLRVVLCEMARASGAPKAFSERVFEAASGFLDALEDSGDTPGEYARARRDAVRRHLDNLPAEMARDLGLPSDPADQGPT